MNYPILVQPGPPRYTDDTAQSRALGPPDDTRNSAPFPINLAYLNTLKEVRVLQEVEEAEIVLRKPVFERRNRYYIADENEKVFFFAKEETDPLSRLCLNCRSLEIHIRDDYGVTLMILRRPLRCDSTCCYCCCCLQEMEVEYPRGIVCANIKQKWRPWVDCMDIVHPEGEVLFNIRGVCCTNRLRCHNSFQVFAAKSCRKVATFHKYCKGCSDFAACINDFSVTYDDNLTAEEKLLLLGAGFLVDLVYLECQTF